MHCGRRRGVLEGVRIVVDEGVEGEVSARQSRKQSGLELLNFGASFEMLCAG